MNHPLEFLNIIEKHLQTYLIEKAPKLPSKTANTIVHILPWLAVVGVILGVPALLIALLLSLFFAPIGLLFSPIFTGGSLLGSTFAALISMITSAGTVFLLGLAIPSLFRRNIKGWNYLFYAVLLGTVGNILNIALVGLIINIAFLYLLFQVKDHYHGKKKVREGVIDGEVKS